MNGYICSYIVLAIWALIVLLPAIREWRTKRRERLQDTWDHIERHNWRENK